MKVLFQRRISFCIMYPVLTLVLTGVVENKKLLSGASMGRVLGWHIACWIKIYHSFLYHLVSSEIAVPEEAAKMFDNFFKDISFAQGSGCRISEQVWGGNF